MTTVFGWLIYLILNDWLISAGPEPIEQLDDLCALAGGQIHRGVEQRLRHGHGWTPLRRLVHIPGNSISSLIEIK